MSKLTGNEAWQKLSSKENTTTRKERENYTEAGLRRLAAAVVQSAVEEYRYYGFKAKTLQYGIDTGILRGKDKRKAKSAIKDCEEQKRVLLLFFKSEKFTHLCDLEAEWVVNTLDRQIKEYNPAEKQEKKEA